MRKFALVVFTAGVLPAFAQVVTDTQLVTHGKGKELLRKINGRWWSQDNREVYPPGKNEFFWTLDSEPGVVDFFHHEPVDLTRGELLHLFMTPAQVEPLLGKPNRIFRMGPNGGMWYYYATNGTKLQLRFMDGELGEAEYGPVRGDPTPVASVAADLGGRNIYSVRAERASKRSAEDQARRVAEMRRQMPQVPGRSRSGAAVPIPQAAPSAAPAAKRIVTAEALAAIQPGMTRAQVIEALGEPSWRSSIGGADGTRETLRYHREDESAAELRLVNGRVTQVP